jgi:hypothetical protein
LLAMLVLLGLPVLPSLLMILMPAGAVGAR